jgi:hypothetical protein
MSDSNNAVNDKTNTQAGFNLPRDPNSRIVLDEKLAVALGWEQQLAPEILGFKGYCWRDCAGRWYVDGLPHFYSDLNAMHEVEEQIEGMHFDEMYIEALDEETQYCGKWCIAHATAEQRARAAFKVLTQTQP